MTISHSKHDPYKPTTTQTVAATLAVNTIEVVATHPLAQAITKVQACKDAASQSILQLIWNNFQKNGVVKSYYGLTANLIGKTGQRLFKFVGTAKITEKITQGDPKHATTQQLVVASALAGTLEGIFTLFPEAIRKIQAIEKSGHLNFRQTISYIRQHYGLIYLTYSGFNNIVAKASFTATLFGTTSFIKKHLPNNEKPSFITSYASSLAASALSILSCNPFDIAHTQNMKTLKPGTPYIFAGTFKALKPVIQEDGIFGLFSRSVKLKMIRLAPGMAGMMTGLEYFDNYWRQQNEAEALQAKKSFYKP